MGLFGFGKGKDADVKNEGIKPTEAGVSDKMIWICEKCAQKVARDDEENLGRVLQKALKHIIGENKRKKEVRAHVSSCMNICPERKIAATIADLKSGGMRFIEFEYRGEPEKTAESLYRLL